jgi:hypothetical protein
LLTLLHIWRVNKNVRLEVIFSNCFKAVEAGFEVIDAEEAAGGEGVKTAAQKRKEKKERQKQKEDKKAPAAASAAEAETAEIAVVDTKKGKNHWAEKGGI